MLARDHLNASAERRKNEYDIKVKERTFNVGDWVWYFYPRRYTQRSPKWNKNYKGPFLITKVIPPSDYVIQQSRKSLPQVVCGNKLKPCYGEKPKSWLNEKQHNGFHPHKMGQSLQSKKKQSQPEDITAKYKVHVQKRMKNRIMLARYYQNVKEDSLLASLTITCQHQLHYGTDVSE